MSFSKAIVDRLQRAAARSRWTVHLAAKLRNQCNRVIAYSVCESPRAELNGEAWLLNAVRDQIDTVFDVGANRGDWTALALKLVPKLRRVVVFEPSQEMSAQLKQRFAADRRVEVFQAAVTARAGTAEFFESGRSSEGSSIWALTDRETARRYDVQATSIDDELARLRMERLGLLKVDTEGNDFHVLKGAESALRQGRVKFVQFEYGPNWVAAGSTLRRAMDYLAGFEYTVFALKPNSLQKVSMPLVGEYFGYSNFVAVADSSLRFLGLRSQSR